jgi:uncharacterized protein YjbI with pentapeptide repeats
VTGRPREVAVVGDLAIGLNLLVVVAAVIVLILNLRTQRAVAEIIRSVERSGPVAERWSRAITMLAQGSSEAPATVEMRLAAVYAIEQVARESDVYRMPAMELLAAYVREHARMGRASLEPSTEVQSVLTVLGRSGVEGLDLRRAVLWGADLEGAQLVGVNVSQARLAGASLAGASLARGRLRETVLSDADLVGADLTAAVLRGAILTGADLSGAKLRGADFQGADLTRVRLRGADLREASLVGARLNFAVLDDADLTDAVLAGADLDGASIKNTVLREPAARSTPATPVNQIAAMSLVS